MLDCKCCLARPQYQPRFVVLLLVKWSISPDTLAGAWHEKKHRWFLLWNWDAQDETDFITANHKMRKNSCCEMTCDDLSAHWTVSGITVLPSGNGYWRSIFCHKLDNQGSTTASALKKGQFVTHWGKEMWKEGTGKYDWQKEASFHWATHWG